jgi:hypothetical protein
VCAEEELFFFLGSGEREREGEQVLLTWALGASANIFFSVSSLFHYNNDSRYSANRMK